MGRGRAKAKQTKVARDLKYRSHETDFGALAKELHGEYYKAEAARLRPFDGAAELIRALGHRGVAVVLATSAPDDELQILLRVLGLEHDEVATTSASDVDTAKPEPGIIEVAAATTPERSSVGASR